MAKVCTIYIVRHGQSESNKADVIGGESDPALTEEGRQQAHEAQALLNDIFFHAAYSSHLQRAVETGDIIYGKPIPKNHQLYELRERSFGSLEGKPNYLLADSHLNQLALTPDKRWHYQHVPDMESDHQLSTRYMAALEKVAHGHPGETVLIASHGSALRNILISLGHVTHESFPPGLFKNTGYIRLSYRNSKFTVEAVEGIRAQGELAAELAARQRQSQLDKLKEE